jgi:sugar phosphate isomerase/epimerase
MTDAARAARIFGTRRLRIFSYLTTPGFRIDELRADLDVMLRIADDHDLELMLENEPVCNIQRVDQLLNVVQSISHPRLRVLLDLGNLASVGAAREPSEISRLLPFVDHLHVKDWDTKARTAAPFGSGNIGFRSFLADCVAQSVGRQLTLSIETHVREQPTEATRRSLRALRSAMADIVASPATNQQQN